MTPELAESFHRVNANGIPLAVRAAGAGPAAILLHGFPELSFSWRRQIAALADAGWYALAPDLRGYGATGPHGEVSAYRMANLARDVIEMMNALDIARAVVVGHDFGGVLAWTLARDHADRVRGIISLNTPYTRRGPSDLVETMRRHRGENNYMVRFQEPGVGEALLERNVAATFAGLMRRSALSLAQFEALPPRLHELPMTLFTGEEAVMGEAVMSAAELQVYIDAFTRNGFAGPLNWYRNLHRNWLDTALTPDRIDVPALMISAADDFFLPPTTTRGMERYVADIEFHTIADCGHWTQYEQPNAANALILDWLERRMHPLGE